MASAWIYQDDHQLVKALGLEPRTYGLKVCGEGFCRLYGATAYPGFSRGFLLPLKTGVVLEPPRLWRDNGGTGTRKRRGRRKNGRKLRGIMGKRADVGRRKPLWNAFHKGLDAPHRAV
jgi:hypothetical protein